MNTLNFTDSRFSSFSMSSKDDMGVFKQEFVTVDNKIVGYVTRSTVNGDSFHGNSNQACRRNAASIIAQMNANNIANIYGVHITA